jgi:hypothetical protein
MARRATLRASDAERDQVAERLRDATGEGRLLAEELEDRLEAVFAARTYGDLDAVVADLPGVAVRPRDRSHTVPHLRPLPILALILLVPVLFGLVVAAVVVIATVLAMWALLLAAGWWVFGLGRHHHHTYHRRSMQARGRWQPGPGSRPRSWI